METTVIGIGPHEIPSTKTTVERRHRYEARINRLLQWLHAALQVVTLQRFMYGNAQSSVACWGKRRGHTEVFSHRANISLSAVALTAAPNQRPLSRATVSFALSICTSI